MVRTHDHRSKHFSKRDLGHHPSEKKTRKKQNKNLKALSCLCEMETIWNDINYSLNKHQECKNWKKTSEALQFVIKCVVLYWNQNLLSRGYIIVDLVIHRWWEFNYCNDSGVKKNQDKWSSFGTTPNFFLDPPL